MEDLEIRPSDTPSPKDPGPRPARAPFSRKKRISIAAVAVTVAFLITLPLVMSYANTNHLFDARYSWGDKGTLVLTITSNATTMEVNGSIGVSILLRNTGTTDVRLATTGPHLMRVTHLNGTSLKWTGPEFAPPREPDDSQLVTLKAGKSLSWGGTVTGRYWEFWHNTTYKTWYTFVSHTNGRITLPVWQGSMDSNVIQFGVV